MIKKLLILFSILLLIIPIAASKTEYANIGGDNGDYDLGEGFFGSSANFLTRGIGVSTNTQVPLVVDLDGDGTTEIVIIDGDTIRVLNSSLAVQDTLATGISGRLSNLITFDVDGDGRKEIIVAGEGSADITKELIIFVDYNGTDLTQQSLLNYSNDAYHFKDTIFPADRRGEIQIGCDSVQSCQMHITSISDSGITNNVNLTVVLFNESQIINFTTLLTRTNAQPFCSPTTKNIEIVDINADGSKDYVSTWVSSNQDAGTDDAIIIVAVDQTGTSLSGFPIIEFDLIDEGTGDCIDSVLGKRISPPLSFPAFGGDEGNSESQTMVAFMTSSDKFVIKAFSASGTEIDQFPALILGEGILVSNVFRGNFFPDSGNVDFCAMGYDEPEQELEAVCGSLLSGEFPDTNRYIINVSNKFTVDDAIGSYDSISHSTNHENSQSQCLDVSCSAADLDEVLTPFGIHRLIREGFLCDTTGTCQLREVFFNPFNTSGVFVSVDTTAAGAEDLLLMTNTNLFLFDALFQDQPPEIDRSSISINPCIDSAWKINSSGPIISFTVDDTDPVPISDLDQVFAQVFLYADSTNEQRSAVQGPSTSGTTFFFDETTFNINKTTGSGVIRLLANDTGGIEQDIVNIPFTVADTGLELGECVTEGFGVVVEEVFILDATLTDDATDNAITNAIDTLSGLFGLAGTTIWLIVMLALSIGVWGGVMQVNKNGQAISGTAALGLIAILNALMIILGARFGILSTSLVVIITVIAVVIVGIFLGSLFTGLRSGAD